MTEPDRTTASTSGRRRRGARALIPRSRPGRVLASAAVLSAIVFLASRPPLLETYPFSRAVFDRNGSLLRLTLSADEKYRLFTPLDRVAPALKEAIIIQEDRYFTEHPGINPISMFRAAWHNLLGRGARVGGSTISMQLARLRFGLNTKSIPGKLVQMARALQLELHYSKDELLEAYINLAPYGYNVEGLGAASFIYFHKDPSQVTLPEALTLAVIPQSPARRRLARSTSEEHAQIQGPRLRLFSRWLEQHPADTGLRSLVTLPVDSHAKAELPFEAPHATTNLLRTSTAQTIPSSLDRELQNIVQHGLRRFVREKRDIGIDNAAALLIDWHTMEVLASVGSARFEDAQIHGQVDGTRMRRSPGSALKPFVYALAYDQGLIHPLSLLHDAPTGFGEYEPENFDRTFLGPVSARDALRLSRNIPALSLASELRRPSFYEFLQASQVGNLKPEMHYGLSIVLGGAEVTMRELAQLYAMLARGGELQPLVDVRGDRSEVPSGKRLLSPEASFLALDALRDTVRPEIRAGGPEVFWKTGTSNGFRDAWTAGVFGRYVMVVWVGSFDGAQNPAFVGIRSAAPLFFAIVHAVLTVRPIRDEVDAGIPSLHLERVKVCAPSGDPYDDACPTATTTWFIPGVSPIARQHVFRKVLVDPATGMQFCHDSGRTPEWRTAEYWPTELRDTFERAGIHKPIPPPLDPSCAVQAVASGSSPRILSPLSAVEYHAAPADDPERAIPLRASAEGDVREIFWFAGSSFLGKSAPAESVMWQPAPGRYKIKVVDDRGRATTRSVVVAPDPLPGRSASAAEPQSATS